MMAPYPSELTPALREVLSLMLWHTGPIAHAMRASGEDIPRKAEAEQAHVLHWLIGLVLEHGDDWREHAAAHIEQLRHGLTEKRAGTESAR